MAAVEAYPLAWPDGWPRTRAPAAGSYKVTFLQARDHLANQLKLARGRDVVISTNVPLRRDGLPLANMAEPKDPGVAAYWTDKKGKPRVCACDHWRTVRENLRAVGLTIEALRSIERAGASELLERAFSGFARLPETTSDAWSELGLPRGTSRAEVEARYRELARIHHPDRGGSVSRMAAINRAYHELKGAP
jgi:hypothetical protein